MTQRPRVYRQEELRRALAADPRVGELELDVTLVSDRVVVSGVLPTEDRRRAVREVIGELAPELTFIDETTTAHLTPADDEDRIG